MLARGVVSLEPTRPAIDPAMPWLRAALDPAQAEGRIRDALKGDVAAASSLRLTGVEILRHKPGRRCLIAYTFEERADGPFAVLAKVRVRGDVRAAAALHRALWRSGFAASTPDGISVAQPLGVVPEWRMWLQRRAAGEPATTILCGPQGVSLARRITDAIHKVHAVGPRVGRRHTVADEILILRNRLGRVAAANSHWQARIERLLEAGERLAAAIGERPARPIHRDFYADQVLVAGERLTLVDFDEFCLGDPALDVGNFLGHVIEQALRVAGHPDALVPVVDAMEQRYVALAGAAEGPAVRAFTTLTLARHIFLSTQFPDRLPYTDRLLNLCESRLGV